MDQNQKNVFLLQSTNSNSYFDLENDNDQPISFIDSNLCFEEKLKPNNFIESGSPVRFSTHFQNIKEDDSKTEDT